MTASPETAIEPQPHVEEGGSGPPVLLLHGWGGSSQLWRPIMDHLTGGFSVLAPDLPGFGRTPAPPEGWSRERYVRWVLALLDSRGLARVHVVGHSFGGSVAIKLAALWPERVDRLVLTSSAGIRPPRTLGYRLRVARFKVLKALAAVPLPSGVRRRAAARVAASGSEDYRNATGTMRPTFVMVVNEDLRPDLRRIAAPTLLVWGDRDDATPLRDGREMEATIRDAGLVVFPGAGHYAYLEQPWRFCKVLDAFLAG